MDKKIQLTPIQMLAVGFAVIIVAGAFLLMLPVANRTGEVIPFIDALMTAASATCVTGLVVYDTYQQFTIFGQIVIILLIQIGGLGFMTVAVFFSMAVKKRIGLKERSYLMESVSATQLGGVVRLVRHILIGTLFFEGVGAVLLSVRFCRDFGIARGIWFGVFHSISAFCNAGFDLLGCIEPYSSLVHYADDVLVNLVVTTLIIVGGIGFLVWEDIAANKWHFKRYRLHTKIMVTGTAAMIVLGTALFFVIEADSSMKGMGLGERFLASYFQAVTPRTAGFNTIELTELSEGGAFLTVFLMFVGAGPGSTGGGVKITTFAVLILSTMAFGMGKEDINIFKRRLEKGVVRRAYSSAVLYMSVAVLASFAIMALQGFPIRDTLFEVFSAIGTVGLTTGITRELLPVSRVIITILMYSGRVGSLSVAMAVAARRKPCALKNPEEKIIVG